MSDPIYLDSNGEPIVPPKGFVLEKPGQIAPGTPLDEQGRPKLTLEQFGQTIKAKYPEYTDMSDGEAGAKVLAKFPQYQDMVLEPRVAPGTPLDEQGRPMVTPPPGFVLEQPVPDSMPGVYQAVPGQQDAQFRGPESGVSGILHRAESALETRTADQPEGVKATMISPERGAIHVTEGVVNADLWTLLKGVLETATIPSYFVGPGSASVGKLGEALEAAPGVVRRAAQTFTPGGRRALASEDVLGVLNDAAKRARLPELEAATAREGVTELATAFQQRAQTVYREIDQAVGGEMKPVLEKMQNLRRAIKTNRALDPEKAEKFAEQLAELAQTKGQLIERAARGGIRNAEEAIAAADKDWSTFRGLEYVGQRIKSASGEIAEKGRVAPDKLVRAVDFLENKGKIVKALGEEGAADLKDAARSALSREALVSGVKKAAKVVGVGLAGGYGLSKLFEGEK